MLATAATVVVILVYSCDARVRRALLRTKRFNPILLGSFRWRQRPVRSAFYQFIPVRRRL